MCFAELVEVCVGVLFVCLKAIVLCCWQTCYGLLPQALEGQIPSGKPTGLPSLSPATNHQSQSSPRLERYVSSICHLLFPLSLFWSLISPVKSCTESFTSPALFESQISLSIKVEKVLLNRVKGWISTPTLPWLCLRVFFQLKTNDFNNSLICLHLVFW